MPETDAASDGLSFKTLLFVAIVALACIAIGAGGVYVWHTAQKQKLESQISELQKTPGNIPAAEAEPMEVTAAGFSQFNEQGISFIYPENWELKSTDGSQYFGDAKLELETKDGVGILIFDKGQAQALFGYYSAAHCRETNDPAKWQGWDETGQRDSPICNATTLNFNGKNAYVISGGSPSSFIYNLYIPTANASILVTDSLNGANGEYNDAQMREVETRGQAVVRETARTLILSNPALFN